MSFSSDATALLATEWVRKEAVRATVFLALLFVLLEASLNVAVGAWSGEISVYDGSSFASDSSTVDPSAGKAGWSWSMSA